MTFISVDFDAFWVSALKSVLDTNSTQQKNTDAGDRHLYDRINIIKSTENWGIQEKTSKISHWLCATISVMDELPQR